MGVVPARCRAVPAGAARWSEPGGVPYGALAPHVATDGVAAGAGAIIFALTLPMQVSRASHRRSDPTTQSGEHERYQGGFVGDDGRSQPHTFAATSSRYLPFAGLLPPWPSSHSPKLRSRLYSRSSTVALSAILAPRPICFSSPGLPLHPHLNLAHPSLFAPPFPSPSSPRLRPPPTLPFLPLPRTTAHIYV